MNLYTYVLNNPLKYVDPSGNYCVSADGKWAHSGECSSSSSIYLGEDKYYSSMPIISNGTLKGVVNGSKEANNYITSFNVSKNFWEEYNGIVSQPVTTNYKNQVFETEQTIYFNNADSAKLFFYELENISPIEMVTDETIAVALGKVIEKTKVAVPYIGAVINTLSAISFISEVSTSTYYSSTREGIEKLQAQGENNISVTIVHIDNPRGRGFEILNPYYVVGTWI